MISELLQLLRLSAEPVSLMFTTKTDCKGDVRDSPGIFS